MSASSHFPFIEICNYLNKYSVKINNYFSAVIYLTNGMRMVFLTADNGR